jgi:hypothetical protein
MPSAETALHVADWRRRTHELYAEVRWVARTDPAAAHALWRRTRDDMFRSHPATPLLPEHRADFERLDVADYDPAWRFELEIRDDRGEERHEVETGTDGVVPFELLGSVHLPAAVGRDEATLDVWRSEQLEGHARLDRGRPQLRLQPLLRLRPGLGLPPRAGRRRARLRGPRRRDGLLPGLTCYGGGTCEHIIVLPASRERVPSSSRSDRRHRPTGTGDIFLTANGCAHRRLRHPPLPCASRTSRERTPGRTPAWKATPPHDH